MKKMLTIVVVLFVAFVMVQGIASAKMVVGKVKSVDNTAKSISVANTDPMTGAETVVTVEVPADASLSGVASLAELKEGADVWVDANEDVASSKLIAASLKVTSPAVTAPVEAPAPAVEAPAATPEATEQPVTTPETAGQPVPAQ